MKSLARTILRAACSCLVFPAVLCCLVQHRWLGSKSGFVGWSQLFSLFPGIPGVYLRYAFFRGTARRCDANACISFGTVFSDPAISIGRSVYVGCFCTIGDVTLEDDVLIASHVSIMNGCQQHGTERLDLPIREQPGIFLPITVGCGSWIGEKATVAADIGRHCLIGAGALVLKPIPDYAIAVGVPARIIGDRRQQQTDQGSQPTCVQLSSTAL